MGMAVYAKARRAKKKQINKKKVICTILLFIIIILLILYFISCKFWKNEKEEITETQNIVEEDANDVENQSEIVDISNIPEKMGKYDVLGQLVIDKIELTKNILNISENESLKLSVAKLYGPNLNESGNFCIDGHNWNNMLKRLSEIEVGDTLYIINRNTKEKVNYEVFNTYTCVPEDLSCLDQNNDGKKELTIITCTPGGAKRFICKAREV